MMKNDLINELLLKMTHNKQWAAHPGLPSILASLPNLASIEIRAFPGGSLCEYTSAHRFSSTQSIFAPRLRALRQAPGALEHFVDVSGTEEVGDGCDYGTAVSGGASGSDDGDAGDRK